MRFRIPLIVLAFLVVLAPQCQATLIQDAELVFQASEVLKSSYYNPAALNWPKLYNGALNGMATDLKNRNVEFASEKIKDDASKEEAEKVFKDEFKKARDAIKDQQGIPKHLLEFSAVRYLLMTVDDSHTSFMDPEVYRDFNQRFKEGSYSGIGVIIKKLEDNFYYLIDVFPNGPASKAGLKPYDQILEINGEAVPNDMEKIRGKVRGPKGTEVELTLERKGEKVKAKIKRGDITRPLTKEEVLISDNKKLGYFQLHGFEFGIDKKIAVFIKMAEQQGVKGLILDLRGNRGGYITTLYDILKFFLPKGTQTFVLKSNAGAINYQIASSPITDLPLVVLIDEDSRSASEVFAAVIQEQERGKIVGVQSHGSVSVGQVHE
ncbi:MAG: S41 family peptidase, partial [Patescibacteria group bacterium]